MIEVRNFSKRYGKLAAVDDLSFRVGSGEILGLIGPNGAGKTTTLRTLAGVLTPSAGRLTVSGYDLVGAPRAAKRQLGYIPDDPRLFDSLTVWEHLEFTAAAYGVGDYRRKAEHLLREFDLDDKRDTLAHGLSLGMRQKLAIVCAYLFRPTALLFDEPLTGLDPRGIRAIQNSIRQRAAEGAAVIVSSHLLDLVENLCSHLLILHQGRCRGFGTMREMLAAHPGQRGSARLEDAFFAVTDGVDDDGQTKTPP